MGVALALAIIGPVAGHGGQLTVPVETPAAVGADTHVAAHEAHEHAVPPPLEISLAMLFGVVGLALIAGRRYGALTLASNQE